MRHTPVTSSNQPTSSSTDAVDIPIREINSANSALRPDSVARDTIPAIDMWAPIVRLGSSPERKRVLHANDGARTETAHEQRIESVDTRRVPTADRAHLDDFSFDQLDAIVFRKYPRLRHAVILIGGEHPACGLSAHHLYLPGPMLSQPNRCGRPLGDRCCSTGRYDGQPLSAFFSARISASVGTFPSVPDSNA
jgi:hypothetical protein